MWQQNQGWQLKQQQCCREALVSCFYILCLSFFFLLFPEHDASMLHFFEAEQWRFKVSGPVLQRRQCAGLKTDVVFCNTIISSMEKGDCTDCSETYWLIWIKFGISWGFFDSVVSPLRLSMANLWRSSGDNGFGPLNWKHLRHSQRLASCFISLSEERILRDRGWDNQGSSRITLNSVMSSYEKAPLILQSHVSLEVF